MSAGHVLHRRCLLQPNVLLHVMHDATCFSYEVALLGVAVELWQQRCERCRPSSEFIG